ncbi:hypothetical protein BpHYR1_027009 [Brachionus plicatilis]|uniref:Uncharacterized protein n=1 Tax=Brachionus plicatilis TaxID=10195 RepID=A0A3M7SPN3_BRAPC|nr:hypothetical protein BpHYR1_027009 [Brachionus plicatilis]
MLHNREIKEILNFKVECINILFKFILKFDIQPLSYTPIVLNLLEIYLGLILGFLTRLVISKLKPEFKICSN